ncbi:MAG: zinc ABC transporter substrate-binding protein [Solirubrobacterales bacterium]|nr:zinc ABC transporter substrate-binding protein [Solirubrobacterales bacterium]
MFGWFGARARRGAPVLLPLLLALVIAACGTSAQAGTNGSGSIRVVAAENFWGSIASQLAGSDASVQSIITNPAEDPHSYEPSAADARTLATAQLVIVNGIGYDPWAPKLLAANPVSGRTVLAVGELFGLKEGDNPHRWYDPADVEAVATAITGDLKKLDPKDAASFEHRLTVFESTDLARYHSLIAQIRQRYAGVPVGASESIFALQAPSLGLRLLTPYSFMKAISEGTEVTAQDTLTTQQQITAHQIKVWVYNSQNATPEIQRLNAIARAAHIPITTITETLAPSGATFEQWQVAQLTALAHALHTATGR